MQSISFFDIDLSSSVAVGDKDSDMEAGRRAGVGRLMFLKGKYEFAQSEDIACFNSLSEISEAFSTLCSVMLQGSY